MAVSTVRSYIWLFSVTAALLISTQQDLVVSKVQDLLLNSNVPQWIYLLPFSLIGAWLLAQVLFFIVNIPKLSTKNKAVFITGCDSGFGYHLAIRLANRGYRVFAGCLFPNGEGAKKLVTEKTSDAAHKILIVPCDVTSEDSLKACVETVRAKLSSDEVLWGLVANAGLGHYGYLEWTRQTKLDQLFAVNVFGIVKTYQAFASLIRKSKGRVVVTTSWAGRFSPPTLVPYSMTKHAAVALCDGLRAELAPFDVHVSSIEPNMYRTSIIPLTTLDLDKQWAELTDEQRESYGEKLLKRSRNMTIDFAYLCQDDLSSPLGAFEHAISAQYPKATYLCDRPLNWFTTKAVLALPQEVMTFFLENIHIVLVFTRRLTYGRYASKYD